MRTHLGIAAVLAAFAALVGCGAQPTPHPAEDETPSTWTPPGVRTDRIQVHDGGTVTVPVGRRATFVGPDDVNMRLDPSALDVVTLYGDPMSLLALTPGRVQLTFPNADKHFDCPDGPCAHPNAPLRMTMVVTRTDTPPPPVPSMLTYTPDSTDRTIRVRPGQRIAVPHDVDIVPTGDDRSAATQWRSEIVALAPGTATYEFLAGGSQTLPGQLRINVG